MVLISLTLVSLLSLNFNGVSALWPQPRQLTTGTTPLKLSKSFDVQLSGISSAPKDLQDAIQTLKSQLTNDKLAILTVDRGASFKGAVGRAKTLSKLSVSLSSSSSAAGTNSTSKKPAGIKSISEEAVLPLEQRQEGYTLSVPVDGSVATLEANSTLGLYRGLTTFGQLWFDLDGTTYLTNGPVQIQDSPLYVSLHSRFIAFHIAQ
jgi:hexosaminidase